MYSGNYTINIIATINNTAGNWTAEKSFIFMVSTCQSANE